MKSKKNYEKKRVVKPVSILKIEDADILEYTLYKEFSTYVKQLIRRDMCNTKQK